MAKGPYIDPEEAARIDAKRQAYYAKLASGEEKLPVHKYSKVERPSTPTPDEIARTKAGVSNEVQQVQIAPEGGIIISQDVTQFEPDENDPRTHTKEKQMSRGALVEDDEAGATEDEILRRIATDTAAEGADAPPPTDPAPQADPRDAVEIGDTWEDQPWDQLRTLAKNFANGALVTNKEMAKELIRAEIERRNSE